MAACERGPWRRELYDFVRAFSGAFISGAPLLYTMEMWWIGRYAGTWKVLLLLAATFVANLGLAYFAGFRRAARTLTESLFQAVDAVAVGIVASAIILLVLNRIGPDEPPGSILGQIVIQTVPLSLGASVANAVFGGGGGRQGDDGDAGGGHGAARRGQWWAALNDVGATIIGGIFIGFSIAPTQEVPTLAARMELPHQLALIALSLIVTYMIVFASGFDPEEREGKDQGLFQRPLTETIMAYVVSLIVAFGFLYLLDQLRPDEPFAAILTQVLVLGLPTAIGGAAGRLIL